jgi:hypothetical protein
VRTAKAATWMLAAVMASVSCSKKEELDMSALAPAENLFPVEEIRENFNELKTTPFGRDDLALSILVPKDWRDIRLKVPREVANNADANFVPLCRQMAPEGESGHPMIEVRYVQLDMEIGLTDFVINYLDVNGIQPLIHNHGKFNDRQVEDVVISNMQDGESFVARMTFSRHGDKIFLVVGSAQRDYFMYWAKAFGVAAVSFTPRRKPDSEFAEPMTTFVKPGPPYLEFRYPTSWVLQEPADLSPGKVGTDVVLMVDQTTFGYIHAKAVIKTPDISPNLALLRLKRDFRNGGITVGEQLRESCLDSSQPKPLARLQVWSAMVDGKPGELATLVLENSSTIYSLGLLVPPRKKNILAWMNSWRVFEIVYKDVIKNLNRPATDALPRF